MNNLNSLIKYNQWILWELQGGLKKPIDYKTGFYCSAIDPKNHTSYSDAMESLKIIKERHPSRSLEVGFVLTKEDPFFFIDIDGCIDENGKRNEIAQNLMDIFSLAYTEVSSSGRGIHIIGQYHRGDVNPHSCKNSEYDLELYTHSRFVALTNSHSHGEAGSEDYTLELNDLIERYFKLSGKMASGSIWTSSSLDPNFGITDDEELIKMAMECQSMASIFGDTPTFKDLWTNNIAVLAKNYPSPAQRDIYDRSLADYALAGHLAFWTGGNCDRIMQLMLRSELKRSKWDRPGYLQETILRVISKQEQFYINNKKTENFLEKIADIRTEKKIRSECIADLKKQLELFDGMVYIKDQHRIWTKLGDLLSPDQFKMVYGGYVYILDESGSKTTTDAYKAFSESRIIKKTIVDGTCFKPDMQAGLLIEKEQKNYINIYLPIQIKRTKGDVSKFKRHCELLVQDDRDREIMMSYIAAIVQYLGTKFNWAILLQGAEGNGKTFVSECVAHAVGLRYTHWPRPDEMYEKYNDWLIGKTFIAVEDIYSNEKYAECSIENLKIMIDRPRIEIRGMHKNKRMEDICCNFIFNTNHADAIKRTKDDRRFASIFTSQQEYKDIVRDGMTGDYFSELYGWALHGGYEMVSDYLMTYPIDPAFNPATTCRRAPKTSCHEQAIAMSRSYQEQEIAEAIARGDVGFRAGWISSTFLDGLISTLPQKYHVSRSKRVYMIRQLGYISHPGLKDGRVNNVIKPDHAKPRLYVSIDHYSIRYTCASQIAQCYTTDQIY